jgi:hypothetical protein
MEMTGNIEQLTGEMDDMRLFIGKSLSSPIPTPYDALQYTTLVAFWHTFEGAYFCRPNLLWTNLTRKYFSVFRKFEGNVPSFLVSSTCETNKTFVFLITSREIAASNTSLKSVYTLSTRVQPGMRGRGVKINQGEGKTDDGDGQCEK